MKVRSRENRYASPLCTHGWKYQYLPGSESATGAHELAGVPDHNDANERLEKEEGGTPYAAAKHLAFALDRARDLADSRLADYHSLSEQYNELSEQYAQLQREHEQAVIHAHEKGIADAEYALSKGYRIHDVEIHGFPPADPLERVRKAFQNLVMASMDGLDTTEYRETLRQVTDAVLHDAFCMRRAARRARVKALFTPFVRA